MSDSISSVAVYYLQQAAYIMSEHSEESKCQLAEIVQYTCDFDPKSPSVVTCYPIPRIFRMSVHIRSRLSSLTKTVPRCPGRPAVEITSLAEVNVNTGEIEVPSESRYIFSVYLCNSLLTNLDPVSHQSRVNSGRRSFVTTAAQILTNQQCLATRGPNPNPEARFCALT